MIPRTNIVLLGSLIFLALINSFYILNQTKQALVLRFGEVVRTEKVPGLKFKIPLIEKVNLLDKRLLNVVADEKEVIANDQKRLIVNAFAKYRIDDPQKFYQTVRDENGAKSRLNSILDSSLRQILGEVPLAALLTGERAKVMKKIRDLVNNQAVNFGINVLDVRILRADLPKENSAAIYKRMQTDREKEAKEFRAEGAEQAQIITSRADKERTILLAEAERKAQIIRGEGDAIAAKISADAFNLDPDFYSFYRSMQAYNTTLNKGDTSLILSPESEFLRYFNRAGQ